MLDNEIEKYFNLEKNKGQNNMSLVVKDKIELTVNKGVPTQIGIGISNEYLESKTIMVLPSCGCVTGERQFVLDPFQTIIKQFTITRLISGVVNITFQTNDETKVCTLDITVI